MGRAIFLKRLLLKAFTYKARKSELGAFRNILVIRWNQAGGVGDTIILTFLLRELKKAFPGVALDVMTGPSNHQTLTSSTSIDRLLLFHGRGWWDIVKTILPLRRKYDLVLDCSFAFTTYSLLFTRLLAPKVLVGVPKPVLKYGLTDRDFKMYDYLLTDDQKSHYVDIYVGFLKLLGVREVDTRYDFPLPDSEVGEGVRRFAQDLHGRRVLLFNLFSIVPERSITTADAKKILDDLMAALGTRADGLRVVMTYPPDGRATIERFVRDYASPLVLASAPTASIYEAAYLVKESDVVLSADTSIVHIASAYDKPLVGIYRDDPGAYLKFGPRATRMHVVISKDRETLAGFDRQAVVDGLRQELNRILTR